MRRRQSKLKMGLRGRMGFLAYMLFGIAVVTALYYVWNNFLYTPPSRITYSSVQGLKPGHMEQWEGQNMQDIVMEEPPIGLNKEIELQMQNEKWKKAKALQDRIDEERLLEEQAADESKNKNSQVKPADKKKQLRMGKGDVSRPLLFRPADPNDGSYFSRLERLVHLDLKGAPPLVSYFEQLFPVLNKLGATGLLMEYEDMFPYSGTISVLAANNAYSMSDLRRIQEAAKTNSLEIIPLVQTFGHMEFVLKHGSYRQLRESDYTPQVITPVKNESYTLIFDILDQIVKAHPNSRRVHLGCDEVYELGKGKSSSFIASQRITPSKLFLQHVSKIARHLKKTHAQVKPLIWDDWLRNVPLDVLEDSGLGGLVEPVVWFYQHDILARIPESRWEIYGKLFPAVWVASAFKGATGSSQIITNASVHLDNNLQWVDIIRTYGVQRKVVNFRGFILTGWQRYDHFATLCELLPVGLPSLALCLQAVRSGGFGTAEMANARQTLSCSGKLDLEFPALTHDGAKVTQDCRFPGSAVYYGVQQLWGIMENYKRDVGLQERIVGWLTDYHVRHGISSPGQLRILQHKLAKVVEKLQGLLAPFRENLQAVYDESTVDEWVTTNLVDRKNQIMELVRKAKKLQEPQAWPARPFPQPDGVKVLSGLNPAQALANQSAQQQQAQYGGLPGRQDPRVGYYGSANQQQKINTGLQQNVVGHLAQNAVGGGVQQNAQLRGLVNGAGGGIALKPQGLQPMGPKPASLQDVNQQHQNILRQSGSIAGLGANPQTMGGGAGQQNGGNGNNLGGGGGGGGALARILLSNSSQSQGRPSGPGKMQPLPDGNVRLQPGNLQGLGQYVAGLQPRVQEEKLPQQRLPQAPNMPAQDQQRQPRGPGGVGQYLQNLGVVRLQQNEMGSRENVVGLQQLPQQNGEISQHNEPGPPYDPQQRMQNNVGQGLPRLDQNLQHSVQRPPQSNEGPQRHDQRQPLNNQRPLGDDADKPKFHMGVLENQQAAGDQAQGPAMGSQLGAPNLAGGLPAAKGLEKLEASKLVGEAQDLKGAEYKQDMNNMQGEKTEDGQTRQEPVVPGKNSEHAYNDVEKERPQEIRVPPQKEQNGYKDEKGKVLLDSFFGRNGPRGNAEEHIHVSFDKPLGADKDERDEAEYNADDDA